MIDFRHVDVFLYWVATAFGVARPLAGLRSKGINNARDVISGVIIAHMTLVISCFAMAKV
jgi:hypothetical protein